MGFRFVRSSLNIFSAVKSGIMDDKDSEIPIIRQLQKDEILQRYQDGERNFSHCVSLSQDFSNMNLAGANFKRAKLIGSTFANANLEGASFVGAELSLTCFSGANLKGANFSLATITGANFTCAYTEDTNFAGAAQSPAKDYGEKKKTDVKTVLDEYSKGKRDFSSIIIANADFGGKKLNGIILKNSVLQNSNFSWCDLTNADISNADLMNGFFIGATLRNTNFSKAYMYFTTIRDSHLEDTNFEEADLSWCDISGANLACAKIAGTKLAWSIIDGSKMSEDQFFLMPPDVLRTIKFVSAEGESNPTKVQGADISSQPYASVDLLGAVYGIADSKPEYSPKSKNLYTVPESENIYKSEGPEKYAHKGKKTIWYQK